MNLNHFDFINHDAVFEFMRPHGGIKSIVCLREGNPLVTDGSAIFKLATNHNTQFIVHLGASSDEGQVVSHVKNCWEMEKNASASASSHILMPLVHGVLNDRFFCITPLKQSLHESSYFKFSKRWVRPKIMRWIAQLAGEMKINTSERGVRDRTSDLLTNLASLPKVRRDVAIHIDNAIKALDDRSWHPTLTIDHNDLWCGNFLYEDLLMQHFFVIDWGGANLQGYGVHDVICCGQSFGLSKRAIQDCIHYYCQATNIELKHSRFQYLSSLAHLYSNLN